MNPTNDPQDDELRALLRAVRDDSERKAPPFSQSWRAAKARQQTAAPSWRLAWAAATAVAIAIVVFIVTPRQPKPAPLGSINHGLALVTPVNREPASPDVVSRVNDEGLPTDFLLTTNNDDSVDRVASQIDALLRP